MSLKVEIVKLKNGRIGRRLLEAWNGVPKGFVFDGASSPRFLWWIIPPFRNLKGSCKHDFDCSEARKEKEAGFLVSARFIREKGDKNYGEIIGESDGAVIGFLAWAGVRVGSFFGCGWDNLDYEVIE